MTKGLLEASSFSNQVIFSKSWLLLITSIFYDGSVFTLRTRFSNHSSNFFVMLSSAPTITDTTITFLMFQIFLISLFRCWFAPPSLFLVTYLTITRYSSANDYYFFFGCIITTDEKVCPGIWKVPAFWNAKVSFEDERYSKYCYLLQAAYCDVNCNSSSGFSRLSVIFSPEHQ